MKNKRFIAGAVCPSCSAMDTTMVFMLRGQEHLECVDCSYSEIKSDKVSPNSVLPKTRISKEEKVLNEKLDTIRIIDS